MINEGPNGSSGAAAAGPTTLTGDVTGTGTGTIATTLATTIANPHTFSDAITLSKATGTALAVDTDVLVVDATNNRVGVNKAAPAQALDVVGNVFSTGQITSTLAAGNSLVIDTNTLVVDASNNRVGIGTASPAQTLDVRGAIVATSNVSIDPTGSSTGSPRTLGMSNFSSGNAARWQFGDALNAVQNAFNGRLAIQSYWGLEILGGRQSVTPHGFTTGTATDPAVTIGGSIAGNKVLLVQAASGQSVSPFEVINNSSASLFAVSSAGAISAASNLTYDGLETSGGTNNITAFAGGGQASATALTKTVNFVTTVASANDSVKLPTAALGTRVVVFNLGANSLNVFPNTGAAINALATNAAIAVAAGSTLEFWGQTATQWRSR